MERKVVALTRGIHQALTDLNFLVEDLIKRPTRLYDIVPLQITLEGYHDASDICVEGQYSRDPPWGHIPHKFSLVLWPYRQSPWEQTPSYGRRIFPRTLQHGLYPRATQKSRSPTVT